MRKTSCRIFSGQHRRTGPCRQVNGGGGTVVFGVADQVVGREKSLPGVPFVVDVHRLGKSIYEHTDPKITPVFEEVGESIRVTMRASSLYPEPRNIYFN